MVLQIGLPRKENTTASVDGEAHEIQKPYEAGHKVEPKGHQKKPSRSVSGRKGFPACGNHEKVEAREHHTGTRPVVSDPLDWLVVGVVVKLRFGVC